MVSYWLACPMKPAANASIERTDSGKLRLPTPAVNPLAARHLVLGLAVFSSAGFAAASDAPQSALAKLTRSGEVSCQPSLPFFCSNMHVSCSGQTAIETFPFKLRASLTHGSIDSARETENIRKQYENGRVEWDSGGTYVILLPRLMNGYIKLLSDGTYSFRYYSQHLGVMSLGRCN